MPISRQATTVSWCTSSPQHRSIIACIRASLPQKATVTPQVSSRHCHTCSPFPGATKNSTSMQRGPDCLSGSNATQNASASTRSPIGNSDKPARAATIFNHNGARPAQPGCLELVEFEFGRAHEEIGQVNKHLGGAGSQDQQEQRVGMVRYGRPFGAQPPGCLGRGPDLCWGAHLCTQAVLQSLIRQVVRNRCDWLL